jgi:hypothetical protein
MKPWQREKNVSVLSGKDHKKQLVLLAALSILTNCFLPLNVALYA